MMDLGSLGLVKQLCTADLSLAVSLSATASVSAMMAISGMYVGASIKFNLMPGYFLHCLTVMSASC